MPFLMQLKAQEVSCQTLGAKEMRNSSDMSVGVHVMSLDGLLTGLSIFEGLVEALRFCQMYSWSLLGRARHILRSNIE